MTPMSVFGTGMCGPMSWPNGFDLTLTSLSLSVAKVVGTGLSTATIARLGGYTGPITISVQGAPDNMTILNAVPVLTGGLTGSLLTVAIRATAPGYEDAWQTLTITVP